MDTSKKNARPEPPAPVNLADAEGLDTAYAKDLIGLILRAPRRHPILVALILVLGIAVTAAAIALYPRVYVADTRILAQRNLVMPLLGNPRRPVPADSDAPTRAAAETILQRDSLIDIIEQTGLVSKWSEQRAPMMRLKDRVLWALAGPPSAADMQSALIGLLEKKLSVRTDNTTIRISVEWGDPEMAHNIVATAQRNFLSGRTALETAVINDTIAILEDESKKQGAVLASTLAEVERIRQKEAAAAAALPSGITGPAASVPKRPRYVAPAPEAAPSADIAALLAEKRRAIRELDEPRQRRLAALNAQLADLELTYAPAHPAIIELQAKIKAASAEPPEITNLRREEQALLLQLESKSSSAVRRSPPVSAYAPAEPPSTAYAPAAPLPLLREEEARESPELEAARTRLYLATRKFEDLMDRIDSAQIELHTAQAAFKYRYTIVLPPEVPKKPDKPNLLMLAVGGLFLTVVLALFAAAAKDFTSGRFVEAWQVRRRLKIPMLAEVRNP